jgi:predicted RNA binding protein YcfA (HicA-like mRNA interferase family)
MAKTDIHKLVRELKRKGWEVEQGRKHFKAKHPEGGQVILSCSPSCPYAANNARKDIEKIEQQHQRH